MNNQDYPKLDSITFKLKYKQINTNTIIEKPKKDKRWNVGVGVGTGYGLINKKPDVFVGVSISYKLF